jgi:CHAT domain-containing protein
VRRRSPLLLAAVLIGLGGAIGCQRGAEPERLYAEAEGLRLKYEKQAGLDAIAKYRDAMAAWSRKGDRRAAAKAAQQVGATHGQLGALRESLQDYQNALALAQESGDGSLESEVQSEVGVAQTLVSDREDDFEEAQVHCRSALESARRLASDRGIAKGLNCLGEVAYHQQRPELALQSYREAGRVWDKLGDRAGQAQTMLFQGYVFSDLSRFDLAHTHFERARSLWTSLGDKRQQAITLVAEARLQARRGFYQEALNGFDDALTLLQPMGDVIWEGATLTGMAAVYQDMAENRSALKYFERALKLFETAGLAGGSLEILGALGEIHLASGDDTNALMRFERALTLAEQRGIQYWRAKALRFIGVVHLFRHGPQSAVDYLERSLAVQRRLGSSYVKLQARTRADLGEAHVALGEYDVALKNFGDALALSRTADDRVAEARALFGLARTSVDLNALKKAQGYIGQALRVAESLRTEVENRDLRASYFASVYQWHELQIDVMMRLGKIRPETRLAITAFEASERARARSLIERLAEAGVNLRAGVDHDLLTREQVVKEAFEDWANRNRRSLSEPGRKLDASALAEEYRDLEYRYNQVQAEIRRTSPRYAALARPQPLSLKELQRELLDRDTLLLEYSLGEERSYLWAVSNKDHQSYQLPPRAEIERAAQHVYELLTVRLTATGNPEQRRKRTEQADVEYWQEAARLSKMLLGPVRKTIPGKRLLLVTDGALQYLPFTALPVPTNDGEPVPMIVEHEIVNLPSASVLVLLRREVDRSEPPLKAVAVFADPVFELDDPRLPSTKTIPQRGEKQPSLMASATDVTDRLTGALRSVGFTRDGILSVPRLLATRREADAIIGTAPAGLTFKALDFDASRPTAMSPELSQYRVVHFASHGIFNNEDPGLSGIILSMFDKQAQPQDGFLRLHDIYSLKLPAELVVLSACNTALGKPVKGEGLVGMVRGFMYAGAKRVIASYWKVDDEATGELMRRFYVEMLQKNLSPAAALRQAQLSMRQYDRWVPPFYWAAFAMQGEWK